MTEKKTFEQVQKEVDEKVAELHKINEEQKNWYFRWFEDSLKKINRKYARRVWNWKERRWESQYRSIEPDDYHNFDLHKNDKF